MDHRKPKFNTPGQPHKLSDFEVAKVYGQIAKRRRMERTVTIHFTEDGSQGTRKRADLGAMLLYKQSSFTMLVKKMYRECIDRAGVVPKQPKQALTKMNQRELFYSRFLEQDLEFAETIVALAPAMEQGDIITATTIYSRTHGEPDDMDVTRYQAQGVGRVMKIMGWPRVRVRDDRIWSDAVTPPEPKGRWVWGYRKPSADKVFLP